MKKNLKKLICLFLCIILCLAFGSCKKEEKDKTTLIIGTSISIEQGNTGEYNFNMLASGVANPPVVYVNENGDLCERFVNFKSLDSQNWTLTLNDDYFWADGTQVGPDDLLWSIQEETSINDQILDIYAEEDCVKITLNSPNTRFEYDFCTLRLTPSLNVSTSVVYPEKFYMGPYMLEEFSKDSQSLSFVPNPYWNGKSAKYEKVIFKLFGSADSLNMALANGEIDLIWNYSGSLSEEEIAYFSDYENIKVTSTASAGCPVVLCFNLRNSKTADINLRNAVYEALDFSGLCEYLGGEDLSGNRNFVSPASIGYSEVSYKSEPKASDNSSFGTLSLIVNGSNKTHVKAGEILKRQLEEKGFSIELTVLDKTNFQARTTNSKSNGNINFEMAIMNFTAAGMNMKEGLGSIYIDGSHAVQGACGAEGEEFSNLLSAMQNAKTLVQYKSAAADLQDWYSKNLPAISLYQGQSSYAYNTKLGTLKLDRNLGLNCMENFIEE